MGTATSGTLSEFGDDVQSPVDIWANYPSFTESKLFHEYLARLTSNRDMHVIITAASETGVGKTTLAFVLALLWDMHGWTVDKATLSPREYEFKYDEVPPGSVLLLDEVEQAVDRRRSSSHDNVNLSHAFAGKRYRQVFGIMTAPTITWVDDRIGSDSVDYWIQAQETPEGRPKGEAKVYRLKNNEHYQSDYKTRTETISWPVMDWHPEFQKVHELKVDRFEGSSEDNYVTREEYEQLKENYWNKATKQYQFHLVRSLYHNSDLSQQDIADVISAADEIDDVSQSTVSNIKLASSFEEWYDS